MKPSAPVFLRLVTGGASSERPGDAPRRRFRGWLGVAIAASIAIVAAAMAVGGRSVRSIPDDRRMAIYSRALADLKESCDRPRQRGGDEPEQPDALKTHCRELASFLIEFDECRGDCEKLVRRQLVSPTR